MTTSDQINELAAALAKAQGVMAHAKKDSTNTFFAKGGNTGKYADLTAVWEVCRAPLAANGLSVLQSPSAEGATVSVETTLMHTSGQWMRGVATATARDDSPQAIGSVITYLRRYALQSFAGVATDDDDAEAGQGRGNGQKAAAPVKPAGYDVWVVNLTAKAQDGFDVLSAFYKVRSLEADAYRNYLTATEPQRIEGLKAVAQAVTDMKAKQQKVAS